MFDKLILTYKALLLIQMGHLNHGAKSTTACWNTGQFYLKFSCGSSEGPIIILSGIWAQSTDCTSPITCVTNMTEKVLQPIQEKCDGQHSCNEIMTQEGNGICGQVNYNYQEVFYSCEKGNSGSTASTQSNTTHIPGITGGTAAGTISMRPTTIAGTTFRRPSTTSIDPSFLLTTGTSHKPSSMIYQYVYSTVTLATVTDKDHNTLNTGVIIGVAVGAIAVMIIILIIIIFCLKKKRKKKPGKYESSKPQEVEGNNNYDTLSDFSSGPKSDSKAVKSQNLSGDPAVLYSVPEKTVAKKKAAIRRQEFLAQSQPGDDDNAYGEAWEMGSGHTGQGSGHTGQGDSEDGPDYDYDYVRGPEDILQDRTSDDYDTIGGRDDQYSDIGSPVKAVEDKQDCHQTSVSDDEDDFTSMAENTIYT